MIEFFSVVGSLQSKPFLIPDAAIFLGGLIGVMVSGALLYTGRWRTRVLAILIVVARFHQWCRPCSWLGME